MATSSCGITLTPNAISQILDGQFVFEPVLQVLAYKLMGAGDMDGPQSTGIKYRLMLSDGTSTHQRVIVANADLVEGIKAGNFEKFTIIRLTNYNMQEASDGRGFTHKIIYAINIQVLKSGSEVKMKLGNPVVVQNKGQQQQQQQPPPQHHQQQQQPPPQQHQQQQLPQPPAQQRQQYQANNSNPNDYMQRQQQQNQYQQPPSNGNNGVGYQSNGAGNEPYRAYDNNQQNSNQYNNTPQKTNIRPVMPSTPSGRACNDQAVIDIASLTPYIGGKWVIKGRVTMKSAIRTWNNAKGEGHLFSFTVTDKSGEIKFSAFNQDCDKWYNYIEQNKIYFVARGQIKTANKRFTNAEYECTLNSDSVIEECMDTRANLEVPQTRYEFVSIGQLSNHPITSPVDVIGIIDSVGEVGSVMLKTKNKETKRRNITIVDMTRHDISVTLWGEAADTFTGQVGQVFVSKAARLGEYGGRSLSAGDAIWIDPDLPETRKMKAWFANVVDGNFTHLTTTNNSQSSSNEWRPLKDCSDLNMVKGEPEQVVYSKIKATILSVGPKPIYRCCPADKCGKKLEDGQTGDYLCSKCSQSYTDCKYRYKADLQISDATGSQWITLWDEKAENLFGQKPTDLHLLMQQDKEQDKYDKIMSAPNFKTYIFTLKTGVNTYNNEERLRHTVLGMSPCDFVTYGKKLVEDIKQMSQMI